jgi:hypothetical protein
MTTGPISLDHSPACASTYVAQFNAISFSDLHKSWSRKREADTVRMARLTQRVPWLCVPPSREICPSIAAHNEYGRIPRLCQPHSVKYEARRELNRATRLTRIVHTTRS